MFEEKQLGILFNMEKTFFFVFSKMKQYSKTSVKRPLSKRPKIGFQDQLSLNAGQLYCRMLPLEHSAILKTFIKVSFVIKISDLAVLHRFYCI